MTGREKLAAAFSPDGASEFPAVTCYHSISLRDHWEQCTAAPWWWRFETDPAKLAQPWLDMAAATGDDWYSLLFSPARSERNAVTIETTPDGRAFRVTRATGAREELRRPSIGGDLHTIEAEQNPPARGILGIEELDALLDARLGWKRPAAPLPLDDGTLDAPHIMRSAMPDRLPLAYVGSPFWRAYWLWGFSGLMEGMLESPELIEHACARFVEDSVRDVARCAAAGAGAIWIEDCMTDMISPAQFRRFNVNYLRPITEAVRAAKMRSVHYFCGRPNDRWELLMDTGADALALEESKKNFVIDIEEVAGIVKGRMTLLGNIDAIGVLEQGSEEALRAEIARQCRAGRLNRNRFILSIGSPVTPATPLSRVRMYTDIVHSVPCSILA